MERVRCLHCPLTFSRKDNLSRHMRYFHGREELSPMPVVESKTDFRFKHPFCMALSGPSGSGKTAWIASLFRHGKRLLDRLAKRVVWAYGHWQPSYDRIKVDFPDIEFVKGIPYRLGEEGYFDPRIPNLLVLDDLMGDAKNDTRIADLFTRGSHHGNLSVIYVTQNLFPQGKASRDIALNCHYLVLFNSPVDRQQMTTLARRLYPQNVPYFMRHYQEAIQRPYGYLLVDLKPDTPDYKRLRTCVLPGEHTRKGAETVTNDVTPCSEAIRGGSPFLQETCEPAEKPSEVTRQTMETPKESLDIPKEDWPSCTFCGLLFASERDLVRHLRKEHPDSDSEEALCFPSRKRRHREDDGPATKKVKLDQVKELPPFWVAPVHYRLRREFGDEMDQGQEDYEKKGYDEDLALRKAINDMLPALRKRARQIVSETLVLLENINNDPIYAAIMPTARRLQKKGSMNGETAIRAAVRLFKDELNPLLVHKRDESETEEEEEEEEEGDAEESQ